MRHAVVDSTTPHVHLPCEHSIERMADRNDANCHGGSYVALAHEGPSALLIGNEKLAESGESLRSTSASRFVLDLTDDLNAARTTRGLVGSL